MKRDIVTIGASVGGLEAVSTVLSTLPAELRAALFVVVHVDPRQRSHLPELLSRHCKLRVAHPIHGTAVQHGMVYVAPPDMQMYLQRDVIEVVRGPRENGSRPAVDALFRTAARAYGSRVVGVVLSGALDCGTAGMMSIKARGGAALVQSPESARVASMPLSCIEHVEVDEVAPPNELPGLIQKHLAVEVDPADAEPSRFLRMLEGEDPGHASNEICPSCGGSLTEVHTPDFMVFRCHVGHTFSLDTMLDATSDATERALWGAVRALEESAALAGRVAERAKGTLRERMEERRRGAEREAEVLRRLLLGARGLHVHA